MENVVIGILEKPVDAQRLIDELMANCKCDRENISVLARGSSVPGNDVVTSLARRFAEVAGATASAAGGAATKAAESLLGVVTRTAPDRGVFTAVGPLALSLAGASLSSAGGLAKSLAKAGAPDEQSQALAEAVERGAILVSVEAQTENSAKCVRETMARYGVLAPEHAPH
jgi:hypothetical protein